MYGWMVRAAYLVVLVVAGVLGLSSDAHAQSSDSHADYGDARSHCDMRAAQATANPPTPGLVYECRQGTNQWQVCRVVTPGVQWTCPSPSSIPGTNPFQGLHNYPAGSTCLLQDDFLMPAQPPPAGTYCSNGCNFTAASGYQDMRGVFIRYEPTGGACTPSPTNQNPNNPDNDACQPDHAPTDPNSCGTEPEGDSDGDGVPDEDDVAPDDPTNGGDQTGDESDNSSSGGGSCSSPPSSSGDAIAAQIAYQTWATRCAAEALVAQGGSGGGTTNNTTNNVTNNYTGGAEPPEEFEEPYPVTRDGTGVAGDAFEDSTDLMAGIDDSGFGLTRTCPELPQVSLGSFGTVEMPTDLLCDTLSILATMILFAGFVQAAYIIGKG